MKRKRVLVTRYGGPDTLQVVEDECPEPRPGEARVRVLAAGVSMPDIMAREGVHPETPRVPFTPGWDFVGEVERLGEGTSQLEVGQWVAGLPIHGAYAEYICVPLPELVPVPPGVDAGEAVSLVLNYVTAYQMLHRAAKVRAGEHILIHGATGGVGTALLQLGGLAGLQLYGTCSARGARTVSELGGIPIDYRGEDFVTALRRLRPEGVDAVFDPLAGSHLWHSRDALRPGGRVVGYGLTASLRESAFASTRPARRHRYRGTARFAAYIAGSLLAPGRKRVIPYSIQVLKRWRPAWFRADLTTLLELLRDGKIAPIVAQRFHLCDARDAQERLLQGGVTGKIVLVADGFASASHAARAETTSRL